MSDISFFKLIDLIFVRSFRFSEIMVESRACSYIPPHLQPPSPIPYYPALVCLFVINNESILIHYYYTYIFFGSFQQPDKIDIIPISKIWKLRLSIKSGLTDKCVRTRAWTTIFTFFLFLFYLLWEILCFKCLLPDEMYGWYCI